jgi:hypothetical protein
MIFSLDGKSPHQSHHHSLPSPGHRNYHLHRAGGSRFHAVLLSVLHNQRKRHILVQDSESNKNPTKTLERQAVDDAEVKQFLKTPGHLGPTFVFKQMNESLAKYVSFSLLSLTLFVGNQNCFSY